MKKIKLTRAQKYALLRLYTGWSLVLVAYDIIVFSNGDYFGRTSRSVYDALLENGFIKAIPGTHRSKWTITKNGKKFCERDRWISGKLITYNSMVSLMEASNGNR